jgi:hypothetical protein
MEFYQHAEGIRRAVLSAIEVYFATNGLPFHRDEFVSQKESDLTMVGKEALFYGAEVFPDAPLAS